MSNKKADNSSEQLKSGHNSAHIYPTEFDEVGYRKRTIYRFFIQFGMPVLIFSIIVSLFEGNYSDLSAKGFIAIFCLAGAISFKYTNYYFQVVRVVLLVTAIAFLYFIYSGGGGGATIFWFFTYPLVALYLLGHKEGMIWCIATLFVAVILLFDPTSMLVTADYPSGIKIRFLGAYCLVILLGFMVEKSKNEIFGYLKRANVSLSEEIQERIQIEEELNKTKIDLERRVRERTKELEITNKEMEAEIKNRIDMEKQLRESKDKYKMILENMDDGYLEIDLNGNVLFFNKTFQVLMNVRNEGDLMGSSYKELIADDDLEAIENYFREVYKSGRPSVYTGWNILRNDKEKRYWEMTISPLTKINRAQARFRVILRDMSKRRQYEEMLISLDKAKNDFMDNLSHHIRTPLHGILGFACVGENKSKKHQCPDLHQYFQEINASGEKLLKLIDDLLELSELEVGKAQYLFQKTRLSDLVSEILSRRNGKMDNHSITIDFKKPIHSDMVVIDKEMIAKVIANLFSNAVRFSREDGTVKVTIEPKDSDVVLSVIDNGVGITNGDLRHIFDKFTKGHHLDYDAEGTGIGLAISKRIVSDHYGDIWAEKNPSGGAIFRLKLKKAGM